MHIKMSGYSKMVLIPENEYKNMIKSKTLDNQFLNNANAKQMTNIVASDLDKINIQFDQGQDKGTIRIQNKNTEEEMKERKLQNQSTQTQLYNKPANGKPISHVNQTDNNDDNNNTPLFTTEKHIYTKPHKPRPYMRDQNAYSVPIISNSNPNPIIMSNPNPNPIIITPNSNTAAFKEQKQIMKPPFVQIQTQDNQNISTNSDHESEMEIDENQPKSSLQDQESQTAKLSRNQETQTEMKIKPFMRDQNMQTEFTSEQGMQTDRLSSINQKDFSTQIPLTSTFGSQTEYTPVHKEIEIQTNFPERQIHITPKTSSEIETQTDFPSEHHTMIPPVSMQTEEIISTPIQSNIISDPISNPLPTISEHISNPIPLPSIYEPLAIGDVESPIITDVTDIPELTYDTHKEDDIILENYPLSNFPLNENRQNVIRINDENLPQFANFSEYPPNFYYLNRDDDTYRTVLSPQNYPQIRNASFNMFNDNPSLTHRPAFSLAPEIQETLQNEHLIPSLTYQRRSEIPALTYSSRSNDQTEKSREKRRQNIQQQREKKKDQMSHRKLHENKYEDEEPIPSTSFAFKSKPDITPKPNIKPESEPKVVIEESAEQHDLKPKKEFKHKGKGKKSKRKPRNDDDYKDEKNREKRRETLSNVRKKAKDKSLGRSAEWLREMGITGTGKSKRQNIRKRSHYDYDTDPENTFAAETYEYRKQRIPKKKLKKKTS
jgi:hypothetical protein